jgi:hypothetical protein
MKRTKLLLSAASAAVLMTTSAFAQQQEGEVQVNVGTIASDIARNIEVDVDKIPSTIKAPVSVAATVCEKSASDLIPQAGSGTAECTATTSSDTFDQLVRQEIRQDSEVKGLAAPAGDTKDASETKLEDTTLGSQSTPATSAERDSSAPAGETSPASSPVLGSETTPVSPTETAPASETKLEDTTLGSQSAPATSAERESSAPAGETSPASSSVLGSETTPASPTETAPASETKLEDTTLGSGAAGDMKRDADKDVKSEDKAESKESVK